MTAPEIHERSALLAEAHGGRIGLDEAAVQWLHAFRSWLRRGETERAEAAARRAAAACASLAEMISVTESQG
jgi:hypothetical protein